MTITILGFILGILLLAVPLYMFYMSGARLLRPSAMSLLRMFVQTALIGALLWWLYEADHWALTLCGLLVISLLAALLTARRGRLRRSLMLLPVWGGMFVSVLLTSLYLEAFVLRVDGSLFAARWLMAVGGALLAASAAILEVSLREYFVGLVRFRTTYYYRVGNGARWYQAVMPIVRRAFERSYRPVLARVAVMGVVIMPFLMSGLLMGSVPPIQAAAATAVMICAALFCSVLAFVVIVVLSHRFVIDKRGALKDCVRLKPKTPVKKD